MERFPLPALLAGIAAGILFTLGIVTLVGPVASDSPSEMAAKLADGRFWSLLALFGAGLWAMLGLWFLTTLCTWLRLTVPNGGEELGTLALVAGSLGVGLALIGMSLFYGATYDLAEQGGSSALLGLVDAANAVMMLTKFPGALLVISVSIAASRSSHFPRWFANLGFLSVAVVIASAIGLFTTDSFTQFGGPLDFYGTLPAALWGVLLMGLLYRGRRSPTLAG
jgi:hypothetical protein